MDISLSTEAKAYLEEQVKAGRYASIDDAVNALVAAAKLEEEWTPQDVEELRGEIAVGLADIERGDVGEWDADEMKRRIRDRRQSDKRAG